MTSPRDRWSAPVDIDLVTTGKQEVGGPFEALIWLTERWPYQQGLQFVRARSACRGALAGHTSLEAARDAFQCAVDEAVAPVKDWGAPGQSTLRHPI